MPRHTQQRHPSVPLFHAASLAAISTSFARRAKAIKYQSAKFACTRVTEEGMERLNIDVALVGSKSTQVRLSIWEDEILWFGVHQLSTKRGGGWAFAYRRHGTVKDLEPATIVAMLEQSLTEVYVVPDSAHAAARLDEIWTRARMQPA